MLRTEITGTVASCATQTATPCQMDTHMCEDVWKHDADRFEMQKGSCLKSLTGTRLLEMWGIARVLDSERRGNSENL